MHNFTVPDFERLYSQSYDERMIQWRLLCAEDKARNIREITQGIGRPINSVLEVGCGTGAVLRTLSSDVSPLESYPTGGVSGWWPSLLMFSAFVLFACVLSVYINGRTPFSISS
jgi:SAM-dependent methyltransferase